MEGRPRAVANQSQAPPLQRPFRQSMRVPDPTDARQAPRPGPPLARSSRCLRRSGCLPSPSGRRRCEGQFVIKGHGYGHGVGMSQWGAYGYAKHGVGYRKILGHYYSHTKLGRTKPQAGRRAAPDSARRRRLQGRQARLRPQGQGEQALPRRSQPERQQAQAREQTGHKLTSCGHAAQGNRLGPDQDLRAGSLPRRAGRQAGGRQQRQRDQPAVARRLRAWRRPARGARLLADGRARGAGRRGPQLRADQRRRRRRLQPLQRHPQPGYGGVKLETKETNKAVGQTAREIVTYKGKPAQTFYYSSSGGRTESSEYGFDGGSPRPYLKASTTPTTRPPRTTAGSCGSRAARSSRQARPASVRGKLREIKVTKTGDSPRIVRARVVGSKGYDGDQRIRAAGPARPALDLVPRSSGG